MPVASPASSHSLGQKVLRAKSSETDRACMTVFVCFHSRRDNCITGNLSRKRNAEVRAIINANPAVSSKRFESKTPRVTIAVHAGITMHVVYKRRMAISISYKAH